jgi:8-oxo-dGTP diphosphatase
MKRVSKAIITRANEFLFQLRDDSPEISYANQWSFFGGEIESGESPWKALQRELLEELGWHPENGTYLYQWENPEHQGSSVHFFVVPFQGPHDQLVLGEGQDLRWFTLEQLLQEPKTAPHVAMHLHHFREWSQNVSNLA